MLSNTQVMIVDDTLREGLQTPGISFKIEEKLKLAELISNSGIKTAMVSYPSAHSSEINITKEIMKRRYFNEVFALGRTTIEDIKTIYDTGANISLHLPFKIKDKNKIFEAIKYASKMDRILEVGIVNITEYNINDLVKLAKNIEINGAQRIQIADTLGKATPRIINNLIKELKNNISIPITIHLHNDIGLAIANAISAVNAKVDFIDTTIFGFGERNGIVDTLIFYTYLKNELGNVKLNETELLRAYTYLESLIVEKIGYKAFLDNFPIYGKNIQINTAGTHVAFKRNEYSINVYTGKNMIKKILEENNLNLDEEKLINLVNKIKDMAVESGRVLTEIDVLNLARELYDKGY